MVPVDQTAFGGGKGNCFAAVVASLLELQVADLPDLCLPWQRKVLCEWLKPRGLWWLDAGAADVGPYLPWLGYHEIAGMGPRGLRHSVVGYRGEVVHDPHPSRGGLLPDEQGGRAWSYGFFVKVDPREVS